MTNEENGDGAVIQRAMYHIREAQRLLELADVEDGTAQLRSALDASAAALPGSDKDDDEQQAFGTDAVLVRAIGGAPSVMTALLVRKGSASFKEVGELFGLYGNTTSESSAEEGLILGCWGSMLLDLGEGSEATSGLN